jgi:hypothetical protein
MGVKLMNLSISRNGVEIGEWTEEEVRSLYTEGKLLPTDYYWKEGMTEWAELYKMIKPTPAVVSKPVVRTQVISVVENKFTQKKAVPVHPASMENQLGISPGAPIYVDKNPSWAAKLLQKLFQARH